MIKKSTYIGVFLLFLVSTISCEKDFTDIGTSVINNSVFETKDTLLDINIRPISLTSVRADGGINVNLGQYLLGVYKTDDYKTVEASFVSQLGYLANQKIIENTYGADTTVVTKMDKVFIQLPFQATDTSITTDVREYKIDSLLGKPTKPVTVKVYKNLTFLNPLNPANPTQQNMYQSNHAYSQGELLNETPNFSFTIPQNSTTRDTIYTIDRNLSIGAPFEETIRLENGAPFMTIPLDKDKIKTLLLDKFEDNEFATQDAFNNYFRGLIVEASGTDGSLVPFSFNGTGAPILQVYFTNTLLKSGRVIDTITRNISFPLTGIRNSTYKTTANNTPATDNFVIQGTAGTMANIDILQGTQLQELRSKNWLINDASLVFYIEKTKDTIHPPLQLSLYKNGIGNPSTIKDLITEGATSFGGTLLTENGSKDRYHFRITDYISDLLSSESTYNPPLGLKVFNATDTPTFATDTIIETFNWDPRGVVLHSNTATNSTRKAQLKISYSVKK